MTYQIYFLVPWKVLNDQKFLVIKCTVLNEGFVSRSSTVHRTAAVLLHLPQAASTLILKWMSKAMYRK